MKDAPIKKRKTSAKRSKAMLKVLKAEPHAAASHRALSRHAHESAAKRGKRDLQRAAQKAVRTKGLPGMKAAARKAARTRKRSKRS